MTTAAPRGAPAAPPAAQAVAVQCHNERPGGTQVPMPESEHGPEVTYHFKPTPKDPRHIAVVDRPDHIARFSSIKEGFSVLALLASADTPRDAIPAPEPGTLAAAPGGDKLARLRRELAAEEAAMSETMIAADRKAREDMEAETAARQARREDARRAREDAALRLQAERERDAEEARAAESSAHATSADTSADSADTSANTSANSADTSANTETGQTEQTGQADDEPPRGAPWGAMTRDELVAAFEARFGRKPHPQTRDDTLVEQLSKPADPDATD